MEKLKVLNLKMMETWLFMAGAVLKMDKVSVSSLGVLTSRVIMVD